MWLTSDGVPVLDHDGVVRSRLRSKPIGTLARDRAPGPHPVPGRAGRHLRDRLRPVARRQGSPPPGRPRSPRCGRRPRPSSGGCGCATATGATPPPCAGWTTTSGWSTRPGSAGIKEGPERRAALLAEAGVDAINLHQSDWTGGLTTLFHRFRRYAFGLGRPARAGAADAAAHGHRRRLQRLGRPHDRRLPRAEIESSAAPKSVRAAAR